MINAYCNRTAQHLLLLLVVLGLAACADDRPPAGEMAEGQEPYLRWCASCHGNSGEGKPPAFPPLAGSEWMELPDQALALIVLYGLRGEIEVAGRTYRGYMPPMQHLSDEDIAAIIGFSVTRWAGRETSLGPADIARLRTVFQERRGPLHGWDGVQSALEELP